MKTRFLLLLGFISFVLFSCQKELSNENGSGGTTPTGNLLVRTVYKQGSDSTVSNYGYDASKRLTSAIYSGSDSGATFLYTMNVIRNSSGAVQKVSLKSDEITQQLGVDSVVAVVNYDASGKYKSKVYSVLLFGVLPVYDSVSFEYDAAGKIVKQREFLDDGQGGGYEEFQKNEYTYSGSNLATVAYSSFDPSTNSYTLEETDAFEYDNKTNPLILGNEVFLYNDLFLFTDLNFYSANNISKETVSAPGGGGGVINITYTYNSSSRPLTSSFVITPGGTQASGGFTYQ